MIGVRIRDPELSLDAMRALVGSAEGRGYHSVWLPESMGRDAIGELIWLAGQSERIHLGTGIVPVFSRWPTAAAAAMATAAEIAPGRVVLGVGIGHRAALEEGHGVAFSRPLQHTREFIEVVRRLLAEGEVSYAGECYRVRRFRLDRPPPQPVPVYVAALRPRMLHLAGAVADGVLMNWATPEYLETAIGHVHEGARSAGRSPDEVRIACYLRTCVTDEPERVESATRAQIARYGSMVYYRRYFDSIGFEEETRGMEAAWSRGDAAAATASVTPSMVRALTIYGSAAECRARLQAYRDRGLELPIIAPFPVGGPIAETFARTIEGCA